MKRLLFVIIVFLGMSEANAQFTKASLQATGLTCAMCSNAINKALQKVPFIQTVDADIKNSAFNIVFKPGAIVDIDRLKTSVEDAGFSIGKLTLTGTFNDVHVFNDAHVQIGDKQFHFMSVTDQVLNGVKTVTMLDKDFLTAKAFKKVSSEHKMECVQTGKSASCCSKYAIPANTRIYHITI
jgi:copper chaperone CopZ